MEGKKKQVKLQMLRLIQQGTGQTLSLHHAVESLKQIQV